MVLYEVCGWIDDVALSLRVIRSLVLVLSDFMTRYEVLVPFVQLARRFHEMAFSQHMARFFPQGSLGCDDSLHPNGSLGYWG